jgi:hypothetical protein
MKSYEEILQNLNILHRKINKGSSTKQVVNARQVTTSISQSRRDDHGSDRKSRNVGNAHGL